MSLNAGAAIFAAAVMFTLVRGAECTVASTCIRPVPLAAPPSLSMYDTLKMIQCQMKCISEVSIFFNSCIIINFFLYFSYPFSISHHTATH